MVLELKQWAQAGQSFPKCCNFDVNDAIDEKQKN